MNHVDNPFQSPLTTISIGPGIRGIERGISRVTRLREIAFVEIEAFIVENLVKEMEAGLLAPAVIWSDAKTFPAHLFRGKVNLLLAGYPCQPFSNAGQRKGTEDPRHLFPYIERTIDIVRPDICFFENVRGHITLGLREVVESLERLGYRVHWGIFSAQETGARHKRERVFILAIRRDLLEKSSDSTIRDFGGQIGGEIRKPIVRQGNWEKRSIRTKSTSQLGNANHTRLQGLFSEKCRECSYKWITWPNGPFGQVSRPGHPQQAWEHPRIISRTLESSVGLSANGYHFREDVLRALGNSVYAETAELAWTTLLRKHGLIK